MTDAEHAVAKVKDFHKFLEKKISDQKSREMYEALGFVIMLAEEHIRSRL